MNQSNTQKFLIQNVSRLTGVGKKTKNLLKKKKIEKVSDLLWSLPKYFSDRSKIVSLNNLEIGKVATIKVHVLKYNFPRIRGLPSRVTCNDEKAKIDIIFFNSREGYIRKILPLNCYVTISGKVNYFRKKYQITNPEYVLPEEKENYVKKPIPKYSLTEGLTDKAYRKLVDQVLCKIEDLNEWHDSIILNKFNNVGWLESVKNLHLKDDTELNTNYYRRLAYDEILSNLLVLSQVRKKYKKIKKNTKFFDNKLSKKVIDNFNFNLTDDQIKSVIDINKDVRSEFRMFRLLQGDVGSGKTIVSFITAANVVDSKYQVALMAPTEILAKQHYNLAKKIFKSTNVNIELFTGKIDNKKKIIIKTALANGQINFVIGTHSLFQKKVFFKNLGLIIIDEQHKFGVKQRIDLSNKGGKDCDVLLMSATPIPRSLILAIYGDMDVSKISQKPLNRKDVLTLSKPEEKFNEIILFVKDQIKKGNQVFWVCPLIEESKILDYSAAVQKYESLSKLFPKKVGIVHGSLEKDEKENVLNKFLKKDIDILVSTTVIEVGIDFPNANVIVIENSNKFGLSQLHQLRGRVGRGKNQGTCILLYKKNLSENARKRIKILKSSNDGFFIAEEDMKLRGFGDMLGFQQSGIKDFRLADPVKHEDLFILAEKNIKQIENDEKNFTKYNFLLKLFDKVDILNQINLE